MAILPFTVSLKSVILDVVGKKPKVIFNDKRVTFERRYKLAGIRDLTKRQVDQIEQQLKEMHPEVQFELKNVHTDRGQWPHYAYFDGLIVKVL